jgi:hypothetical protein
MWLFTKESIIEKTYSSESLPSPLFACLKTGKGLPKRGNSSLWQREGRRDLSSMSIQLWTP